MRNKIFIITNESFYVSKEGEFFCDNIDLKSIPEELNKFFEINIIGRRSNKERSKKILLDKTNVSYNIFSYLIEIIKSFQTKNVQYFIISLSPYTFLASILLKLFSKKHIIYLRSDGYQEYKSIFGWLGLMIYHMIFTIGIIKSKLIACRRHLLKNYNGIVVNPSQLSDKWFKDIKKIDSLTTKLLYVGRVRVEKGVFSLLNLLKDTNFPLTIVTSEKNVKIKKNLKDCNVELISFENYNDSIIKFYDNHSIFILPSYTEAHPQVLDEALARCKPVIVFSDISHVKRDREGVFVSERNTNSLNSTINYINNNYENIVDKIKRNKLPTKEDFIKELIEIFRLNENKTF